MSIDLRPSLLVAALLVLPAGLAFAGNGGAAALPDGQHMAGDPTMTQLGGAANPHVPGATGHTIVIGNHSTIADDEEATEMQRTDPAE